MQLRAATKPTNVNFVQVIRKKVQSIKVVTNDSIGTCSSENYILYLLKLPAPPRAVGTTGKDPLLTYLWVSVPSILTSRYIHIPELITIVYLQQRGQAEV